ncbi:oligopeptide/dipeptide ABC transporter ATP-binding protein [Nonomuraea roseola]|uniref:Oligopeptide/dipeptide ABC transporter ATP-binding protein n=1 Tax=Nonomuraea roseola TaxID=46179 RepID=A0ABV5PVR2_9ACTN
MPRRGRRDRPEERHLRQARQPFTSALLSAASGVDDRREADRQGIVLSGDVLSPLAPPTGCRSRTRGRLAQDLCCEEEPALIERGAGHPIACHFAAS